jgi:predicted Rossmann fold nucleotide-binding protein DprA/Smf involved in DNA uptake
MTSREAILALNLLPSIGPVRISRLLDAFGNAEKILTASANQLQRVDGIGGETAKLITDWENLVDPSKELTEAEERGISIITREDDSYPKYLLQAYDAPILLYVWGKILPRDKHAISVVGSRRSTTYGTSATKKLTYQLAHAGFTIVSGLARGIDTTAHEAALAAKATLITDASQIIDDMGELPFSFQNEEPQQKPVESPDLPEEEAKILAAMPAGEELAVDQLIQQTGLPSSTVTAGLFKLELRRLVRPLPGFRFIRR